MANNRFEDSLDALVRESKTSQSGAWEGTMRDYMGLAHANPRIAQLAPGRIFDMLLENGTTEITGFEKLPHYEDEVKYKFFAGEVFGIEEVLHDLVRFFRAGANRTETGKRILILVGPVSSGKSTIVSLLKNYLSSHCTSFNCMRRF